LSGLVVELLRDDVIHRKHDFAGFQQALRLIQFLRLESRRADRVTLRLEERVAHRAADEDLVDAVQQVLDDTDLVRDLGSPENGNERPGWLFEYLRQVFDFAREQIAHHGFVNLVRHTLG
jgi:hypothetical protein